jgi:hypothetical protein
MRTNAHRSLRTLITLSLHLLRMPTGGSVLEWYGNAKVVVRRFDLFTRGPDTRFDQRAVQLYVSNLTRAKTAIERWPSDYPSLHDLVDALGWRQRLAGAAP